jgi:hypothetical protein
LTSVDGVTDIELDASSTSGTFKAPAGLDVDAMLNKMAEENSKFADWSKAE